jgi:hypothetical protein
LTALLIDKVGYATNEQLINITKARRPIVAAHSLLYRPVKAPTIACRLHRKARILAQMQEDDARRTRR